MFLEPWGFFVIKVQKCAYRGAYILDSKGRITEVWIFACVIRFADCERYLGKLSLSLSLSLTHSLTHSCELEPSFFYPFFWCLNSGVQCIWTNIEYAEKCCFLGKCWWCKIAERKRIQGRKIEVEERDSKIMNVVNKKSLWPIYR